jgi:hypothetical protein
MLLLGARRRLFPSLFEKRFGTGGKAPASISNIIASDIQKRSKQLHRSAHERQPDFRRENDRPMSISPVGHSGMRAPRDLAGKLSIYWG